MWQLQRRTGFDNYTLLYIIITTTITYKSTFHIMNVYNASRWKWNSNFLKGRGAIIIIIIITNTTSNLMMIVAIDGLD